MAAAGPDVIVVGAGVIGLTTAVCLADAGAGVVVWAERQPQRTTSAVAGAMCGLNIAPPDDPAARWGEVATADFVALAGTPGTGVHMMRGRLVSNFGAALPPRASSVPGFAPCSADELPPGFRVGFWAELPFADMPRFLDYLTGRLADAGGRIETRAVASLADVAAAAPVVVNCTGTGARQLANDPEVRAVKGQHVIVENPGLDTFLYEGGMATAWTGFFPHADRVVLGGVAIEDDWDLTPDPRVTEQILERNIAVEPRLADARVLGVEVGLRPFRPAVRLAEEWIGAARCIHNYGHGSVGVSLSWGCAREVVMMVRDGQGVSDG